MPAGYTQNKNQRTIELAEHTSDLVPVLRYIEYCSSLVVRESFKCKSNRYVLPILWRIVKFV